MVKIKLHKLISIILACVVCFSFFSITSLAVSDDFIFEIDCSEPAKSSNQGYLTLLLYNSSLKKYVCRVFAWTVYGFDSSSENGEYSSQLPILNISIDVNGKISTSILGASSASGNTAYITYYSIYSNDFSPTVYFGNSYLNTGLGGDTFSSPNGYTAVGCKAYGYYSSLVYNGSQSFAYSCIFDDSISIYNELVKTNGFLSNFIIQNNQVLSFFDELIGIEYTITDFLSNFDIVMQDMLSNLTSIYWETRETAQQLITLNSKIDELMNQLKVEVPSYEDFKNAQDTSAGDSLSSNFDTNNALSSLPTLDYSRFNSSFALIASIMNAILDLNGFDVVLIVLLTIGLLGFLIGRKLNKE